LFFSVLLIFVNYKRPNGVTFTAPAGTGEFLKRWNPLPGDIVSFKHRGYLSGTKRPKLPTLYRLRTDLTWEDVVNNWKENKVAGVSGNNHFFKLFCIVLVFYSLFYSSFYKKQRKCLNGCTLFRDTIKKN
jgi:signal peptidase I